MKKSYLIGVAFAASLVTANANAEAIVGIDAGWAKVDRLDDSGTEVGVFGRFMSTGPEEGGIGLHIGYAQNSAEDSYTFRSITIDGSSTTTVDIGRFKSETENIIDVLLALRTKPSASGTHSLFMVGYSRAKLKWSETFGDASFSDSDSADGWKLAAGIERPISENAVFSVLAHLADYGDVDFVYTDIDAGVSYGVRAGIGYRF